jgi:malonyl CoA-acyl carrier protein transacylase
VKKIALLFAGQGAQVVGMGQDLAAEAILKDQLDDAILDNVSMAGDRFDRMLKVLTGV